MAAQNSATSARPCGVHLVGSAPRGSESSKGHAGEGFGGIGEALLRGQSTDLVHFVGDRACQPCATAMSRALRTRPVTRACTMSSGQAEPNLHTVQNRSGSFHGGPTRRGCRDSASKDFQRAPESSSSAGTARAVVGAAMDLSRRSRRSTTSVLTSSSRGHRWLAGAQQAIHPPLATLRYRRRRKLGRGVCTNAVLTAALPGGSWGSSVDRS